MKLTGALILLLSLPALSCPELSGSYDYCHVYGDVVHENFVVKQQMKDGFPEYQFNWINIPSGFDHALKVHANGKTVIKEGTMRDKPVTWSTTAKCIGDVLEIQREYVKDGKKYFYDKAIFRPDRKFNELDYTAYFGMENGDVYPHADETVCTNNF